MKGDAELFADFRSALSGLNAEVFRIREPRRLAAVAADLGADFRASQFEGEEGKGLHSLSLDNPDVSKGPAQSV